MNLLTVEKDNNEEEEALHRINEEKVIEISDIIHKHIVETKCCFD